MGKTRIKYICSNCGYESLRWLGKCPECDSWNTFTEELVEVRREKSAAKIKRTSSVFTINEIPVDEEERIKTNVDEFDRVLGGGIIPGSVILLGGDPGIGKSTLAMQTAARIDAKVLYVTGEESAKQIKIRAARLKIDSSDFYVIAETNIESVIPVINDLHPALVIIDSIQTMERNDFDNSPGTVTQIRECTSLLMEEAKKKQFSVMIIGHVTKEGIIAGPKVLEHMVDTVIHFEGETTHSYRILRALKNRFGSTNEIGIFEMHEDGLSEVKNPSEVFLSTHGTQISGSAITSSIEGTRPILLEVQALVTPSHFGNPQRVATGFDYRRLSILLAVLEKRAKLRISASNVFLNMAGGVRIIEPAIDLAVCCCIASSLHDKVIDNSTVLIGEIGLGGEVRGVSFIEKRIQEAEKLYFKKIIIPRNNFKELKKNSSSEIFPADTLQDALRIIFNGSVSAV